MNSAELLDRIEDAATDDPLVEALLLCQKLGGDAEGAELRDWAKHENWRGTRRRSRHRSAAIWQSAVVVGGVPSPV